MNILIVGAGRIAERIVKILAMENHNITVVDNDEGKLGRLRRMKNHNFVVTNPLDPKFIEETNFKSFDVVAALTRSDRANIVICSVAKKAGVKKTVAVFKEISLIEYNEEYKKNLGIDEIVSIDREGASAINDFVFDNFGGKSDFFAKDKLQVLSFKVKSDSEFVNKKISDIGTLTPFLIVAIARYDKIIVPDGDTVVGKDDILYIAGLTKDIQNFRYENLVIFHKDTLKNIMIVGGEKIVDVAGSMILKRPCNLKIICKHDVNVRRIRRNLPDALVVRGDFEDFRVLEREEIERQDVFVCATDSDELNIVMGLMGKKYNVPHSISLINTMSYEILLDELSIDRFVNPLTICANKIVEIIRGNKGINTYITFSGKAEIIEVQIKDELEIVGKKISEIDLPLGSLICGIEREEGTIVVPRGETEIKLSDRLIVFAKNECVDRLVRIFNPEHAPTSIKDLFR